jgi:hypothetical protein
MGSRFNTSNHKFTNVFDISDVDENFHSDILQTCDISDVKNVDELMIRCTECVNKKG